MQELEGSNLDVAMAQHLLVAADRYQLSRLRRICERRLCETVEVRLSRVASTVVSWPAFSSVQCHLFKFNVKHCTWSQCGRHAGMCYLAL